MAIFTALLNSELRTKFSKIEGSGSVFKVPRNTEDYRALQEIPDELTKIEVLNAFSDSFKLCWIIGCGLLGFALVVSKRGYRDPAIACQGRFVREWGLTGLSRSLCSPRTTAWTGIDSLYRQQSQKTSKRNRQSAQRQKPSRAP